jgi:hypothetical protein
MTLLAFVDESEPRQDLDPGTYVLSAAILGEEALDHGRQTMLKHRQRTGAKAHWHDARSRVERRSLAQSVAASGAEHLVVIKTGDLQARTERRRRLSLERLCFELDQVGVVEVVFESRGAADDRRDRVLIDALRARRTITAQLRVDHRPGPAEPLLWIPDVVCGAVNSDRLGDPEFVNCFRRALTRIEL